MNSGQSYTWDEIGCITRTSRLVGDPVGLVPGPPLCSYCSQPSATPAAALEIHTPEGTRLAEINLDYVARPHCSQCSGQSVSLPDGGVARIDDARSTPKHHSCSDTSGTCSPRSSPPLPATSRSRKNPSTHHRHPLAPAAPPAAAASSARFSGLTTLRCEWSNQVEMLTTVGLVDLAPTTGWIRPPRTRQAQQATATGPTRPGRGRH